MAAFTLPAGFEKAAIIQVAMDVEAAPFLEKTQAVGDAYALGEAEFYPRALATDSGDLKILLVRSKIGLVNAATALTVALSLVPAPRLVLSAGTAGGLRADVEVGDLAIGTEYTYTDADATAFGYEFGQVPGMPATYATQPALLDQARAAAAAYSGEGTPLFGQMLAGGSFVTAKNVKDTREIFPQAISTDMETTALAQICTSRQIPFLAIRGISDLCGPAADQDFHMDAPIVAERSATLALAVLAR
ncbi:5'-methylthioadenosine/S-adenosylhomocysteine nucleosidase [Rothia nasimurium]|uniref:5'-methylthioadenosine/S-adenosylhomocysteine nucleosidase n=1 Tax=Rothia nasimurium TaxID=85336 RepID=UPI001F01F8C8|nr:5'-methylthioadenosine/S-adenosylhomocysteine nucleosidase [Rothia nasimurium]